MCTNDRLDEISTRRFLAAIHPPDALIYFAVDGKVWKNKPQTYDEAEPKLRRLNSDGHDIYYVVNSGGTKDANITHINSAFADWDAGRDTNGRYYPLEVVTVKKQAFYPTLLALAMPPSMIVETRNGYQPYWLVDHASTDSFRELQRLLADLLASDPMVANPASLMRLPGYYWHKTKSGCEPFDVRIVQFNPTCRYDFESLLAESRRQCPTPCCNSSSQGSSSGKERISTHNKNRSYNLCFTVGTYPPTRTYSGLVEHLKRQDLAEYLGHGNGSGYGDDVSLPCPFHDDLQPSASIFQDQPTGHYLLRCHSSTCGFSGSIIDVAMRQHSCDARQAIELLARHYGLPWDANGWRAEQREVLEQNIRIVASIDDYREQYPDLCKMIRRVTNDLISKLEIAQDCILDEVFAVDGSPVFFASLRRFAQAVRRLPTLPDRHCDQNRRVDRYCLLKLMRKLQEQEIPVAMFEQTKRLQRENRERWNASQGKTKRTHDYRIQFYAVPPYTPELLKAANNRAAILREKKIRLKAISRTLILDVFGEQVAREVFPQCQRLKSNRSNKFLLQLEQALLVQLKDHGYATARGLTAEMRRCYDWPSVTVTRVTRHLPGLLTKHGLIETYANRQMKMRYGINSSGYPRIIVSNPQAMKAGA